MKEMPQGLPYSNPKPPAGSDKKVHQMSLQAENTIQSVLLMHPVINH